MHRMNKQFPGLQVEYFRRLSIDHLWALTILIGIFIFLNLNPIRPHDFWWHMAVGREIVETGHIPLVDTFSYTALGQPYPSYQMFWLMDVLLYGLYHIGGPGWTILIHSLMITSAYGIILFLAMKASGKWPAAALSTLFAAALGLNHWNVRPQSITFLLGALLMLSFYQYQVNRRKHWLVVMPVTMLIWVNSHGSFPIGLVLIGIWFLSHLLAEWNFESNILKVGKDQWLPAVSVVLSGAAAFVNPLGFGVLSYVQSIGGNSIIQSWVPEWSPPSIQTMDGPRFFAGLLILAVVFALSVKRPSFPDLIIFSGFALLAFKTTRGVPWFGFVLAPILAKHLVSAGAAVPFFRSKFQKREQILAFNYGIVCLIFCLGFLSLPWVQPLLTLPQGKGHLVSTETPIDATRFLLDERLPGRLFHGMQFGSYLIWEAQPDYPVFVDSRLELFPEEVWIDYMKVCAAEDGWQETLEAYDVNLIMISSIDQAALARAVEISPNWKKIYQGTDAVIFRREP